MYNSPSQLASQFLGPLTKVWVERIESSIAAKKRFRKIADQCREFYHGTAGFMWSDAHNQEYFKGKLPKPKFQINLNKAFEYVSLVGPSLFWKYPHRKVVSQKTEISLRPEMFGDPQNPYVQQAFQAEVAKEQQQLILSEAANQRMATYLNWSQREFPGGGLMQHARTAIIDALLTGAGCVWPGTYTRGDATYTKSEYDSIDNLFVDADCHDPLWETAGYVIRRHVQPVWQVERMFGFKRGYLAHKGNWKSSEQKSREKVDGVKQTFDMLEWWEVWSKVGTGPRSNNLSHEMLNHMDDMYGDNVYLCICKDLEHPLNMHQEAMFHESPEEIGERLKWRCPNYGRVNEVWKDGRWPVEVLSFYSVPNSPWPLAPMSPGLGELIAMNVLTSAYVDITWENRKQIIAYLKSAEAAVKEAITSDESFVQVGLNDAMHKSISEAVQILNRPSGSNDILEALAMLDANFNRRVGLNELLYGESRTQVRVAADIRERSAMTSVRPNKMADDVAEWMSSFATVEMFLAAQHVEGRSLVHLIGEYQAMQWDMWRQSLPVEQLMLESKSQVTASEIRRPDKERDTANIQSLQQWYLPLAQSYAQDTTNTNPLNAVLDLVGESIEMDTSGLQLEGWQPPPPDEQQQQLQQITQQSELEKTQSEVERNRSAAMQAQANAAKIMQESVVAPQVLGELEHEQELRHSEENHILKLIQQTQAAEIKNEQAANKGS